MTAFSCEDGPAALDAAVAEVPDSAAVFVIRTRQGRPYLGRTTLLRRRLRRLLGERPAPSRLLNLRTTAARVEYELTGSSLESAVRLYELARAHFPDTYLDFLKARLPPYIKVTLGNAFPRTALTTHVGRGTGAWFGPFRSRVSAERFEGQVLDFFQVRRCQENLDPSPAHPGCIYGEMGMCLRPCQQVVGPDEYAHEAARLVEFFATGGRSLTSAVARARDRFSEELQFEEAARQHKRLEKIQEVLRSCDEMARDVDRLHGAAITRSTAPGAVEMWFVRGGCWLGARRLTFEVVEGKPVSLEGKLREIIEALAPSKPVPRERQEYLAVLARWCYSSWRDGEWIAFDEMDHPPFRRLAHAISRVAQ